MPLASAAASLDSADSSELQRWNEWMRKLQRRVPAETALAGVLELSRLAHLVPHAHAQASLAQLHRAWQGMPQLADGAALLVLERVRAQYLDGVAIAAGANAVTAWQWLGPFSDGHGSGLGSRDEVQAWLETEALGLGPPQVRVRQGRTGWLAVPAGWVRPPLRTPLHLLVDRPDDAIVYALAWVRPRSGRAQMARLQVDSEGAARLWWGRRELDAVAPRGQSAGLAPEAVPLPATAWRPVHLCADWQRLVVKLSPSAASLGLGVSFADLRGLPLAVDVTATDPHSGCAAAAPLPLAATVADAVAAVRWPEGQPLQGDRAAALLAMAWMGWPMPAPLRQRLVDLAVEDLPLRSDVALAHAHLPGEAGDRAERLAVWQGLLPDDVAVLVAQARAIDASGRTLQAHQRWQAWQAQHGQSPEDLSVEACLLRVQLWRRLSAERLAAGQLERCRGRWPTVLAVQRAAAEAWGAADLWPRAVQMREAVVAQAPNALHLAEWAAAQIESGDLAAATASVERLVARAPERAAAWEGLAKALLDAGDVAGARSTLERVPEMLRRSQWHDLGGRVAERSGDTAAAARLYQVAAGQAPHRSDLRARLSVLGRSRPFYAAQRRDLLAMVNLERHLPRSAGVEQRLRQTVLHAHGNGQAARYDAEVFYMGDGPATNHTVAIEFAPSLAVASVVQAVVVRADGRLERDVALQSEQFNQDDSGMYFDLERWTLTFRNLRRGDAVVVEYEVRDLIAQPFGLVFGELLSLGGPWPTRETDITVVLPEGQKLFSRMFDPREPERLFAPPQQQAFQDDGQSARWHSWRWRSGPHPALAAEANGRGWTAQGPYLHVSSMATWADVAKWYAAWAADAMPRRGEEAWARELARRLAQGQTTTAARVRAVFDYVRSQVRYVGLEFGVHSLKPHAAREVAQRQFGDCKDKATLLVALLTELDIAAEVALVRTRDEGPLADGIASLGVFNHAVAYVPSLDMWLDPTAHLHAVGELPQGDAGGWALRIRRDGATQLQGLPETPPSGELDERRLVLHLAADGSATLQGDLRLRGLAAAAMRLRLGQASAPREAFEQDLASLWPRATVRQLRVEGIEPIADEVRVQFQAWLPQAGQRQGDRWLLAPMRCEVAMPAAVNQRVARTTDVNMPRPISVTQRVEVVLPRGWQVEQAPPAASLSGPIGHLSLLREDAADALVWQSQLVVPAQHWRVAQHTTVQQWWVQVESLLRRELVLVATGGAP